MCWQQPHSASLLLGLASFVFPLFAPLPLPSHSAVMCFVLCVEEEREKLRVQVVEAMSEEEIQKRAQEILKQAAQQGPDTEKEMEKENKTDEKKDAAAVETEGKENDEKKEVTEGEDQECEAKKKPDENAEEADDKKKRGENVETGDKLNGGAGSKPKVSSVLKERELNKKVAEISTDEKKEGEEMEDGTEETEPEGDSSIR